MDSLRAAGPPEALRDEPFEPEIVDSELVYEGRVWDVRSDTLRYGGDEIVRQYVDHPGASAIVAVDDEQRVLLSSSTGTRSATATGRYPPACSTSRANRRSRPRSASSWRKPT